MKNFDTFQLTAFISKELREHDYLSFVLMTRQCARVNETEIYDAYLCPDKSPYLNEPNKTVLQANASLLNMMFYAYYSGYLYALIRDDEKYDQNKWTFQYMHSRLGGQIYEPIFISLLPQILDYELTGNLKDLYINESRTVFSIVYRCIYSFIVHSGHENINIYEVVDKNSSFYKTELPKVLHALHEGGLNLFYDSKYHHNRLEGKDLTSINLWGDKNSL